MAEEAGDDAGDVGEDGLAIGPLDDSEGEDDLQAKSPGHGPPADGATIGGEGIGEAEKGDKAK